MWNLTKRTVENSPVKISAVAKKSDKSDYVDDYIKLTNDNNNMPKKDGIPVSTIINVIWHHLNDDAFWGDEKKLNYKVKRIKEFLEKNLARLQPEKLLKGLEEIVLETPQNTPQNFLTESSANDLKAKKLCSIIRMLAKDKNNQEGQNYIRTILDEISYQSGPKNYD